MIRRGEITENFALWELLKSLGGLQSAPKEQNEEKEDISAKTRTAQNPTANGGEKYNPLANIIERHEKAANRIKRGKSSP